MTGSDKQAKTETKKVEELDDGVHDNVTGGGVVGQNFEEVDGIHIDGTVVRNSDTPGGDLSGDQLKDSRKLEQFKWRCRIGAVRFDRQM